MYPLKMKRFLSLLVVLSLVFTLGMSTYATEQAQVYSAEPTMEVLSVEIINGGPTRIAYEEGITSETTGGVTKYYTDRRAISFTDPRRFTVCATFDYFEGVADADFLSSIEWTLGEKLLTQWYGGDNLNTTSNRFIQLENQELTAQVDGTYKLVATIRANTPYSTTNSGTNIPYAPYVRVTKPGFGYSESAGDTVINQNVGMFDLAATYKKAGVTKELGRMPMKVNLYDSYNTWAQLDTFAKELKALSESNDGIVNGRYVSVESTGKSPKHGKDVWITVLADSKASVDEYLNVTKPRIHSDPAELAKEIVGGNQKIPLYISNIHADEVAGPDAVLGLINKYVYGDVITFNSSTNTERMPGTGQMNSSSSFGYTRKAGSEYETLSFKVDDLLDKYILVFCLYCNPDAKIELNRNTAKGLDLNRDAAYQTQLESQIHVTNLNKWDALSIIEFHGHYAQFMIEPCTPPHDPNYEYDLYADTMLEQGNAIGKAVIGNSPYNRYTLPAQDGKSGWDDGAPLYTPSYSMLLSTMAYTFECPDSSEDSYNACVRAFDALAYNSLVNRDKLYLNKLEYKNREIHNLDIPEMVDKYFYDPSTLEIFGRNRAGRDNYFPEYFILPVDPTNQRNVSAAYKMLPYLQRNGVSMQKTTERVLFDGDYYPAGTYVVDMHQSNRGLVNSVLSQGYNASMYSSTYNDITINFPDSRGFTCAAVFEKGLFDGKTETVPDPRAEVPASFIEGSSEYVIVKNVSVDAVTLVNSILNNGRPAYMLTSYSSGGARGDYVVARADYNAYLEDLYVVGNPFGGDLQASAKQLVVPRIAQIGSDAPSTDFLLGMGFDVQRNVNRSDVNIFYNAASTSGAAGIRDRIVGSKIPYFGEEPEGASSLAPLLPGLTYTSATGSHEGMFKADYSSTSLYAANYQDWNSIYLKYSVYFRDVPSGMKVLAKVSGDDDFFIGGWFPSHANFKGRTVAVSGFATANDGSKVPVALFPQYLGNKGHYEYLYNMVATFIFSSVAGVLDAPLPSTTIDTSLLADDMTVSLSYVADETIGTTAVLDEQLFKVTKSEFEPAYAAGDGTWSTYAEPIFLKHGENYYIHWYAENSLHESDQGVFGPYVSVNKDAVLVSVSVDEESDIDKDVEVTLSVRNAKNLLTFEAEFTIDGDMLAGKGIETLSGFTGIDGIFWSYLGGSTWKGKVTLAYKAGSDEGLTAEAADIAKLVFSPRAIGDTALTLSGVQISGLAADGKITYYKESVIEVGEAATNIDQRIFSKYDLNRDGIVDALDLGIMLLYCGFDNDSPAWDTLVKVNDSRGKGVTASMCDVNEDGLIDMLDLLDLFIHYTK
ncbi:MAG: dockerin type I domain-containing protein [Clostridiales bacterium]|nr:dockerin type I domain-containing protein [Clostridiales bacterium]